MSHLPFDLAEHVQHFQARVLQDALIEATGAYWLRRAATFDAVGLPSAAETARACRRHAALLTGHVYAEVCKELSNALDSSTPRSVQRVEQFSGRWSA